MQIFVLFTFTLHFGSNNKNVLHCKVRQCGMLWFGARVSAIMHLLLFCFCTVHGTSNWKTLKQQHSFIQSTFIYSFNSSFAAATTLLQSEPTWSNTSTTSNFWGICNLLAVFYMNIKSYYFVCIGVNSKLAFVA